MVKPICKEKVAMKAATIKISEGKPLMVSHLKGVDIQGTTNAKQIATLYELFNESFVEVENQTLVIQKMFYNTDIEFDGSTPKDGIYPAPDNMFMTVKEEMYSNDLKRFPKQVAILSFENESPQKEETPKEQRVFTIEEVNAERVSCHGIFTRIITGTIK